MSIAKHEGVGRHRLLSADLVNNMIELGTKDAHHRGLSFASLGALAGINASERVIREALQGMGYDRRIAVFESGSNKGPKKDKGKGKQTEGVIGVERDVEVKEGFIEGMAEDSEEGGQPIEEGETEEAVEARTASAGTELDIPE